jgi:hypothetical protein
VEKMEREIGQEKARQLIKSGKWTSRRGVYKKLASEVRHLLPEDRATNMLMLEVQKQQFSELIVALMDVAISTSETIDVVGAANAHGLYPIGAGFTDLCIEAYKLRCWGVLQSFVSYTRVADFV